MAARRAPGKPEPLILHEIAALQDITSQPGEPSSASKPTTFPPLPSIRPL